MPALPVPGGGDFRRAFLIAAVIDVAFLRFRWSVPSAEAWQQLPRLAGELKYFCNSSVIYEFAVTGPAILRVNDHGLSYFDDYALGSTYECGSVGIDQASIVAFAKEFDPQPFHVDPVAAARARSAG